MTIQCPLSDSTNFLEFERTPCIAGAEDRHQVTNLGSRARVGDEKASQIRDTSSASSSARSSGPGAIGNPSRGGGPMCAERVRLMDELDTSDSGEIER